jgi:hypothetical protein
MAKKKKKTKNAEFWDKYRDRFAETDRLLEERIAYHGAKAAEERAVRGEDAA